MFRRIRKKKNEIDINAAHELLESGRRGVFAVNGDDGYPYAIPINYYYEKDNQKIYFHGAKAGHKVDALRASDKVCFTVFGNETIKEESWAPYMQSVVVFGRCHLVEDAEKSLELLKKFAMKYYPDEKLADEEIAKAGKAAQMFEIEIEHMSGKEVQEK
ncbi:MAG: pyridoxamine 5'-phosphate oxidase family protein [Eubacteriales bacterium]|nr:pyridoxamine 5'-phosphate oxidase family protein [Eubacteriales bacterium]